MHFRDFAGQEHYNVSHDIFTVSMAAPSVAAIVVDGTECVDKITQTVSATAANIVCRLSAPDDGKWIAMDDFLAYHMIYSAIFLHVT